MNRHLIVLGIAVLLICVGLSGCTEETDTYIAKPQKQVTEAQIGIDKSLEKKDLYIQFLEERLNKIEQRLNGTADYIQ